MSNYLINIEIKKENIFTNINDIFKVIIKNSEIFNNTEKFDLPFPVPVEVIKKGTSKKFVTVSDMSVPLKNSRKNKEK